jgi:hypothetical protein
MDVIYKISDTWMMVWTIKSSGKETASGEESEIKIFVLWLST